MAQQTAVEWIEHNIQSDMNFMEIMGLIRQAKAMEKQQIIQSSRISYLAGQEYYTLNGLSKQFAEEYYNNTYKK
jgi:hypothetical protein